MSALQLPLSLLPAPIGKFFKKAHPPSVVRSCCTSTIMRAGGLQVTCGAHTADATAQAQHNLLSAWISPKLISALTSH